MGELDSITNINVLRMIIATSVMGVVAVVIFLKRRIMEYKQRTNEDK